MSDTLEIFGTEYTGVTGIKATNDNDTELTYIRPQGTKTITSNGTTSVAEYENVTVNVPSGVDGDDLAYGLSLVGSAIVGSSVAS